MSNISKLLGVDDLEIQYFNSLRFDIKRQVKKTMKKSGKTRAEINQIISKKHKSNANGETFLEHISSLKAFKSQGDLPRYKYDWLLKYLNEIN